jgi:hypothetical protein
MDQLFRLFVLGVCLSAATPAFATDYYVSLNGNDDNAGTAGTAAWRTLARVNTATLRSGDRVLLHGGSTFAGNLVFDTTDGGTDIAPLTLMSYGTGRATISASSGKGVSVYNRAAIRIANVRIVGANAADTSGIVLYTDKSAASPHTYVRIEDTDVSGFGEDGIQIGAWSGAPGFRSVQIVRTSVHDNGRTGILTFADRRNVHRDVYVGYSKAFNNRGIAGQATNTGSGIVFGGVDGGTIERSVAHGNGALSTASEGPVGIWVYDSARIVIQHNESYANRTGGKADGGGFDLDQNVTDSILQFNYSHDNDGAGYLIAHRYADNSHRNNVIRYNVSQNDGQKNGYGAIEIWGRTVDTAIYHNTVVTSSSRAVRFWNSSVGVRSQGVRFLNNIFYAGGTLPLVEVSADQIAGAGVTLAGNSYYAPSGFSVRWGAAQYTSLSAFRNVGQEQVAGVTAGTSGDPGLSSAGSGPTFDDAMQLETLDAYRLVSTSGIRDRGIDLRAFAIDPGARDFFGTPLTGSLPDPGAHEAGLLSNGDDALEVVLRAAERPKLSGNWAIVADPTAAGSARVQNADRGQAKLSTALAAPADYVELTFDAQAGVPYRLWIRGVAQANAYWNDSIFVQFSGSVDPTGKPVHRIGTASATAVVLEDCSGCGVSGWGWQDNAYGVGALGPEIYFETSGRQTIRMQTREDGLGVDHVVLSAVKYMTTPPGATKNDRTILPRP